MNQLPLLLHRLYKERLSQVDIKLQEVMAGCAQEYLEPLANLQENMQIRTKVAGEKIWTTFAVIITYFFACFNCFMAHSMVRYPLQFCN